MREQEKERNRDKKGEVRESWLQTDMEGAREVLDAGKYIFTHIHTHTHGVDFVCRDREREKRDRSYS